jgi:hypothetical protein
MEELEEIRKPFVTIDIFANYPLSHFLQQCFHAFNEDKPFKINKNRLSGIGILSQPIVKLREFNLYGLCHEIALKNSSGIEMHEKRVLYVFLNKFMPSFGMPKKKAAAL